MIYSVLYKLFVNIIPFYPVKDYHVIASIMYRCDLEIG